MDINQPLTPHFHLCEFLHNGSLEGVTVEVIENLRALAKKLEGVRAIFGKPVMIDSGFRTWAHHVEIYAAQGIPESKVPKGSYHLKGLAADIVVPGIPASEVQEKLKDWAGGMGTYSHFTHLDIRPYQARWEGP